MRFHNTQNSAALQACGGRRYATSVSISMLECNLRDLDARSRQAWWNSLRCGTCHSERRISKLIGEQLAVGTQVYCFAPLTWQTRWKLAFYWRLFCATIKSESDFSKRKLCPCNQFLKSVNISQLMPFEFIIFLLFYLLLGTNVSQCYVN